MNEKLEFIQNVKDNRGYDHSIFIVKIKVNDKWEKVFKYGNLYYPTMKEAKEAIKQF